MPSQLQNSVTVGLLAVLCIIAGCSATQEEPAPELKTSWSSTFDLLWTFFERTVKSGAETTITELSSLLGSVQTGLDNRLSNVETELDSVGAGLDTRLDNVQTELSSVQGALEARMDNVQSELSSVQSELSSVQSDLNSVQSNLDSVHTDLNIVQTDLNGVQSQLNSVQSELRAVTAPPVRDCSDLPDGAASGVHLVRPGVGRPVPAYCDMDTDGGNWTVIQRRADIQPRQDFFVGWENYKWGLGQLDAEFWWGNEHLWLTTSLLDRQYELRVDMEDFDGERRHALYQGFTISSEADGYRLTVTNYTGDAGDSLSGHSNMKFSTKDRDHDTYPKSCAQSFKGAWWYTKCHSSNLNSQYLVGKHSSYADGVNWQPWKGYHYSLKRVEMKIRPVRKL